jgi:DNA polymerase-1
MKLELGRLIRKAFTPKEGYVFIDADYSQVELRVLAHLSGDKVMQEAFKCGVDIHTSTAASVFGVAEDEVTPLLRRHAKAVNFGIVYGMSAFGLSEDLGISRKEAADFIEKYYDTYKGVKNYMDMQVQTAKEKGYVTTMFNRVRPIPELKSSNFMQRSFGERVAMNSPIQGSAADIIKIAMVKVNRRLKKENMKSQLILQIHDELLIEAEKSEADKVEEILVEEMVNAVNMDVPLVADAARGNNWYEAK